MKNYFCILFIIGIVYAAQAQYPNGGENNYYTYGEKDGITQSITLMQLKLSDGKIIAYPYGRKPFIIGNNYTQKIPFIDKLHLGEVNIEQSKKDNNAFWLTNINTAYLVNNLNIIDSFSSPETIRRVYETQDSGVYFQYTNQPNVYNNFGYYCNKKVKLFGSLSTMVYHIVLITTIFILIINYT